MRHHLLMDGPGYFVSRREIPPTGAVLIHEMASVRRVQPRTLASHRFRDKEIVRPRDSQRRGMKLHVLRMDDSSAGPVRQSQTVSPRALRIRRVAVDTAQAARGQERGRRKNTVNLALLAVERVGAHAAIGSVLGQGIPVMVRRCDQIDRGNIRAEGDVRELPQLRDQRLLDGPSRSILHV